MDIKQLAKEFYFNSVKVDEWRDNFEKKLETHTVTDKRSEGYYCSHCGKIEKQETAFPIHNHVVFPDKTKEEIWIVNNHYDGCRGWD